MASEGWADNNGTRIHYIDVQESTSEELPLVIIPGMNNSAEELASEMEGLASETPGLASRRRIYISIRGRGESDAPESGYSFADQVGDITAVIDHLRVERFHLFGHSVGASFSLGYLKEGPDHVASLMLGDYAPFYPPFSEEWAEHVMASPHNTMKETALRGVARDAEEVSLVEVLPTITVPVLVLRGDQEGSLLPEEYGERYMEATPDCRVEVLKGIGHDFFNPDGKEFVGAIAKFMEEVEGRSV